jgi:hypothetical protein
MKFFPFILGTKKYANSERGRKKKIKIRLEKTIAMKIVKQGKLN